MTATPSRVLLIGHGEMGHAMACLLDGRAAVTIWQRHAAAGAPAVDLPASAAANDVVIFCVPATALVPLAQQIARSLSPAATAVTFAKGLDDEGRLPATALAAALGRDRVAVLYGPMISEEILAGRPAYAQCAAGTPDRVNRLAALFADSALVIEPADDLTGLSWSAILKNVYAIAFGMADELALGDNVRGYLAVRALREIDTAVVRLGGRATTAHHLAGLGDLITTATSAGSHHHALGRQLIRGDSGELRGEGVHTLAMLRRHAPLDTGPLPLLRAIDASLASPATARAHFERWLHENT